MGNKMPKQKIDGSKLPSPFTGDGKEDKSAWLKHMKLYYTTQQTNISDNHQAIRLALAL